MQVRGLLSYNDFSLYIENSKKTSTAAVGLRHSKVEVAD